MIVDVHTHVWDSLEQLGPQVMAQVRRKTTRPWHRPNASLEAHAQAMKTVDYAFVLGFEAIALRAHVPAHRVAAYVATQPERFIGFAGIDPMGDGHRERLDEAVSCKLQGVAVSPWTSGYNPTHSEAMKLFERCQTRRMPVIVHGDEHLLPQTSMPFGQPTLLDDVARELPELRMIVTQVGYPWIDQTFTLLQKHPHIYADLSGIASRPWQLFHTLVTAYELGVTGKLLLGSNFPYGTPEQIMLNMFQLRDWTRESQLPCLPMEAVRGIVERDALSLLGITPPTGEAAPAGAVEDDLQTPLDDRDPPHTSNAPGHVTDDDTLTAAPARDRPGKTQA